MNRPGHAWALLALLACGCAPEPAVRHYGNMRQVMREGRTEGRVDLRALETTDGTVAVGALAGLAGEVTVSGRTFHIATADGTGIVTRSTREPPEDAAATLLTVGRGRTFSTVTVQQELDEAALSRLLGEGDGQPRPLRIEGTAEVLELHVARGACPTANPDPEHAPFRWRAEPGVQVEIVGFHAPGQQGVMTHHGTDLHLHAVVGGDPVVSGHVDRFRLRPGAVIHVGTP